MIDESRERWLANARNAAKFLARKNGSVTIDDVREECPPPEGHDPRCMGSVMNRGTFQCIGYEKSRRDECHNRPIGRFRLRVSA